MHRIYEIFITYPLVSISTSIFSNSPMKGKCKMTTTISDQPKRKVQMIRCEIRSCPVGYSGRSDREPVAMARNTTLESDG